ncbi:MAG: IS256 family transposase [Chryseobacterium sp.]
MTNQNPEIPVPTFEMYKEYIKKSKECKSVEELLAKDGPLNFMFKDMVQALLNVEMTEHLGYERSDARSKKTDNSRNGSYTKKLKTENGEIQIEIPRDRDGEFEPKIIPKFKTKTSDLERKIISMYAKGMTTSDISEHISDLYLGSDVSATFISQVTDKVLPIAREWQARALDKVYPVVFFDAIHYKVREDGKVVSKAVYVSMAINLEGKRDVLGFYIGDAESSKFWLQVFSDLNNRGIQDILIACVDGLKGLPDAIKTIFPKTEIQLCIVHQIRNSFKYVGSTNQKEFAKDLKLIYTAFSEDHAKLELNNLKNKWGEKYPIVIRSWENNWVNLANFFQYTAPIRKMIYTTNIIEGYNRQLRKVTKNRGVFPTDDSLFKLLYLATTDASKKWNMPRQGWAEMIGQLAIHFEGRVPLKF